MAAATDTVVTQEMLQAAQLVADAAAEVTKPLFRQKIKVDRKEDRSPVTEADRQAEQAMKSIIQERLPSHAVFGEEFGFAPGAGVHTAAATTSQGQPHAEPRQRALQRGIDLAV